MSESIPLSECTLQTCPISSSYFDYPPLLPAAVAYLVYYGIFFATHIFLGLWHKTWSFLAGMSAYLLIYLLGFIAVVELHFDPFSQGWFSLYVVALTTAPTFLVLSLHRCVKQIMAITLSRQSTSFSSLPRHYLKTMLSLDSVGLGFQIIGTALLAGDSNPSTSQSGASLAVTGLVVQSFTLVLALGVCIRCGLALVGRGSAKSQSHTSISWPWLKKGKESMQDPDTAEPSSSTLKQSKRLPSFIAALITVLLTLLVRTLLQAVVLVGGAAGEQIRIQSLYHGEAICMAIVVLLLSVWHPGFSFGLEGNRKGKENDDEVA